MLTTVLAFIVALGLIITIHELGHYSVARLCGVRILRFSIGFGPILLQRTDKHGTQWALSAVPLGGYVKMLDDAPANANPADINTAFNNKPLIQRFAVVAAGPVANLVLALIIFAFIAIWGSYEPAAVLAQPAQHTPAAQSGIQNGDKLIAIDDKPVKSWVQARWQMTDKIIAGGNINLTLQGQDKQTRTTALNIPRQNIEPDNTDPLQNIGLQLIPAQALIAEVQADSAAAQAGLQNGDLILAINQIDKPSPADFIQTIQNSPDKPVNLKIERRDIALDLAVSPHIVKLADGSTIGRIGAVIQAHRAEVLVQENLLDSVNTGFHRTLDLSIMSFKMIGQMLMGNISVKNISGPVTIAQYAGNSMRIGIQSYLNFLALISISIGILNLLPIPMLDGGHLFFYVLEALRGGRPLSDNIQQLSLRVGFAIVMGLMVLALFNDFERLFM